MRSAWKATTCRSNISFDVVREVGRDARRLLEAAARLARRPSRPARSGARSRARRTGTRRACGGRTARARARALRCARATRSRMLRRSRARRARASGVERAVVGAEEPLERHARIGLGRHRASWPSARRCCWCRRSCSRSRSCRPCATPRSRARARRGASARRSPAPRSGRRRRRSGCRRPRSCAGGRRSGSEAPARAWSPGPSPSALPFLCASPESTSRSSRERLERLQDPRELEVARPSPFGVQSARRHAVRDVGEGQPERAPARWRREGRASSRRARAAPSLAPSPRRTVRRDRCFRVIEFTTLVLLPPPLERHALDDLEHQRREAIVAARPGSRRSPCTVRLVVALQAAAQGVGEHLLRDARGEGVAVLAQHGRCSPGAPANVRPSGSAPEASIGNLPSSLAPGADGVEVLEARSPAGPSAGGRPRRSAFARCASICWRSERVGADLGLVEPRRARRRVGRRRVQHVLEDPLAAQHRRGAGRVRRDREHARLREHAAARACRVVATVRNSGPSRRRCRSAAPGARSGRCSRASSRSRTLRSSRIRLVEEQLRLPAHRHAQAAVEVGEALAVGLDRLEARGTAATGRRRPPRARSAFGSASMRRTCGLEHLRAAAARRGPRASSSSSSGMLAQRK